MSRLDKFSIDIHGHDNWAYANTLSKEDLEKAMENKDNLVVIFFNEDTRYFEYGDDVLIDDKTEGQIPENDEIKTGPDGKKYIAVMSNNDEITDVDITRLTRDYKRYD